MVCRQCGLKVPAGERFCPRCGAEMPMPQRAPRPVVKRKRIKKFQIGGVSLSAAQLFACLASIVGLLAFMFYFFAPRTIEGIGGVSFGLFFTSGYTGFFWVIGAIFTFLAVALIALPLVLQLICRNDEAPFEIPLASFVLYLIAFITNTVTSSTLGKNLNGKGNVAPLHVLYILLSVIFLAYCVFAALMAYKADGKIKIVILGYTVYEQK